MSKKVRIHQVGLQERDAWRSWPHSFESRRILVHDAGELFLRSYIFLHSCAIYYGLRQNKTSIFLFFYEKHWFYEILQYIHTITDMNLLWGLGRNNYQRTKVYTYDEHVPVLPWTTAILSPTTTLLLFADVTLHVEFVSGFADDWSRLLWWGVHALRVQILDLVAICHVVLCNHTVKNRVCDYVYRRRRRRWRGWEEWKSK